MASDKDKIIARIRRWGPGTAFTPKDFLDLASRGTVDMTLAALLSDGTIRRLARGLYDYPRYSRLLEKPAAPDLDQVARALARRYRWNIIPDGPLAAHLLGLSTQVPARSVYISDGPTKTITIGRQTIHFKNARPKETSVASVRSEHGTALRAAEWIFTLLFTLEYALRLASVPRAWLAPAPRAREKKHSCTASSASCAFPVTRRQMV